MARQPRTPGAAEAPKATETEVVASTAANADANLDAILGTAETPDSNVGENTGAAEATSTVSEPVAESSLSEILETQKRIETKLDQLLVAGGIDVISFIFKQINIANDPSYDPKKYEEQVND